MVVELEWCGHSYFLLRASSRLLAIDPHDGGSINLPTCRVTADYVLLTHNHFDHNAFEVASGPGSRVVKWRVGRFSLPPFTVEGRRFYHDKARGRLRGEVVGYKIIVEGLSLAHLGDLGHLLEGEDLEWVRGVDILMIPVGGTYTIDAQEAWRIVEEARPRLVVPMHYWIPGSTLPLDPLDRFLNIVKAPRIRPESSRVQLSSLPSRTSVLILEPPRRG
ncbi:MAG: MBL fold metallo-hydrolase [Desulfurococcales archaeon]|nr:MBL fold metallo-hydrolase [Desulfurococcales archaeon]MCE4605433.1 MBL fold metallo-hydrolase [Desulfurococcales archaeon]